MRTPERHTDWVRAVAVPPDGAHLVSAGADNALRIWDLGTGALVASYIGDGALTACAVSPDGRNIVAGEQTGRMHVLRFRPPGQALPLLARFRHWLERPR